MESEEPRFANPLPVARVAIAALGAGIIIDLVQVGSLYASRGNWNGEVPHQPVHALIRLATIVAFVAWIDRVYANLPALGRKPEHSRLMATLGFVIPPLVFFRPVQIVNETVEDEKGPLRWIVGVWWVAFWIPPALVLTSVKRGGLDPLARFDLVTRCNMVNIAAAALAIFIVYAVTARQKEAYGLVRRVAAAQAKEARLAAMTGAAAPAPARPAVPPPLAVAPKPAAPRSQPLPRPIAVPQAGIVGGDIWKRVLIASVVVAALVLIAGGAVLLGDDVSPIALTLIASGVVVAVSAVLVARRPLQSAEPLRRWVAMAVVAIGLAGVNIWAVLELLQ